MPYLYIVLAVMLQFINMDVRVRCWHVGREKMDGDPTLGCGTVERGPIICIVFLYMQPISKNTLHYRGGTFGHTI